MGGEEDTDEEGACAQAPSQGQARSLDCVHATEALSPQENTGAHPTFLRLAKEIEATEALIWGDRLSQCPRMLRLLSLPHAHHSSGPGALQR